jgi:hypothetical protein
MAQDYRDLIVWQKAIDLTVCVYELTRAFPKDEAYGLVSQMRRAAISVASNIAEGIGRLNVGEFRQFLGISQGIDLRASDAASCCQKTWNWSRCLIEWSGVVEQ